MNSSINLESIFLLIKMLNTSNFRVIKIRERNIKNNYVINNKLFVIITKIHLKEVILESRVLHDWHFLMLLCSCFFYSVFPRNDKL